MTVIESIRAKILFEPADWWIGAYIPGRFYHNGKLRWIIYFCLIPTLPLRIEVRFR